MRQYPSLTFIRGRFPGAAHYAVVRCRPGIHWGGRRSADLKTVIAIEAKQSMLLQKERMDCFVAALLAMTACFESHDGVMVSFTAATNWLSVNGFGRNANCWFSGRLFSKASSA